jgi:hypothetical protein
LSRPYSSAAATDSRLCQQLSSLYNSRILIWCLVGLGAFLRLAQFLHNRSLWWDESTIALDVLGRSYLELFKPAAFYDQTSPLGFLLFEKIAVQALGNNEYVLRLVPLVSGIAALFLFYFVAKRLLAPGAVPLALLLFAISEYLVYFSSELKHYSSDVAITLLLILAAIGIQSRELTLRRAFLFSILGMVAVWFSSAVVFVLAGIGLTLILVNLAKRQWTRAGKLVVICSFWALSFFILYFVYLSNLESSESLLEFWSGRSGEPGAPAGGAFAPLPPMSLDDLRWYIDTFLGVFVNPVGLPLAGIAGLTFVVGCAELYVDNKEYFLLLISPILVTLLASGLEKYPFQERLLLFTVPLFLLFVAAGVEQIVRTTKKRSPIIAITVVVLLLFQPVLRAGSHLLRPPTLLEIEPLLSYVREHKQEGDILYLYYGVERPFKYYAERYGFDEEDYIVGVNSWDNWDEYIQDLDKLRGNSRVWLLFAHVWQGNGIDEERFFLDHLDSIGRRLDTATSTGASVYLYDLSIEVSETDG